MTSRKQAIRAAALFYPLMGFPAVFSLQYIPARFIVGGDATATARNISSSETLYRIGVLADFASQIAFVFLVLALYQLLKDVNRRQATLMVALVLVSVPLSFLNTMFQSAPLILLSGADYLSVFDKNQLDALSMGFLRLRSFGINAVTALWGLWLLPFGLLAYRSSFIPRIIGVLLIIGCFAYLAVSVTSILFPSYLRTVNQLMLVPYAVGEMSIVGWLLINAVKTDPPETQPSGSGNRAAALPV